MKTISELTKSVSDALAFLRKETDVVDALVFVSANERRIARLAYASHCPSEGVVEVKGSDDFGLSLSLVLKGEDGKVMSASGQSTSNISLHGVKEALAKARRDASFDPDFHDLPSPSDMRGLEPTVKHFYHDESLMDLSVEEDAQLITQAGWDTLNGAMKEFRKYVRQHHISAEKIGLIVGGDQIILRERMALGTIDGIFDFDESTILFSFVTAMLEHEDGKGSGFNIVTHQKKFKPNEAGKQAAENAIHGAHGIRIPSGKYTVVFGPQAIVDLYHLLQFSFNLWAVESKTGIFAGKYGKKVASPLFSIYDDGSRLGCAGTKRITCEGFPTRRVDLITDGILTGYLSDHYLANRVLENHEQTKDALGIDPREIRDVLMPSASGFRFGRGGGRIASSSPHVSATNVFIESQENLSQKELLERVGDGIYIGRLWYTYPVGGYGTGIFSGTVIADSYVIRDGVLQEPLKTNTVRITDNLSRLLHAIIGVSNNRVPTVVWASDEIVYAPLIAVEGVPLEEISKFLA